MKTIATTTSDRYHTIQSAVKLCFDNGLFRKEIITLSEERLNAAIEEYYERLKSWKRKLCDDPEEIILDRHKVGALTAICIMEHSPLTITKPKEKLYPFEAFPNEFLSIRIAISRILQSYSQHHIKKFEFNERAISLLIAGFKDGSWKARELALYLHSLEENLQKQISEHLES